MSDRALNNPETRRLLGGISNSALYRGIANGIYPPPVKLGHSSRWLESEVLAVLKRAKDERDRGAEAA